MVDAHALGACGFGRAGSNPASPTTTDLYENRLRDGHVPSGVWSGLVLTQEEARFETLYR